MKAEKTLKACHHVHISKKNNFNLLGLQPIIQNFPSGKIHRTEQLELQHFTNLSFVAPIVFFVFYSLIARNQNNMCERKQWTLS